jgi:hypothetical protein
VSITLTSAQIPPDHIGAIIARLRRVTNLMALCPDQTYTSPDGPRTVKRISGELAAIPEGKDWKKRAVVVLDAGGPGAEYGVPFATSRVDCLCYAATGLKAAEVANLVIAALEPVERHGFGFVEANCAVTDVHQISGVTRLYDRENKQHVRAVSFEVRYAQVPAEVAA